ncbi:MAG: hypothetical protein H6633_25800 [Anaerolineales bacterium]|nr:hypothetical protein [Anaerolineales bacterium]
MMTIALAVEYQATRRVFWLKSPEPDRGLVTLLLCCLTLVTLGLAADIIGGLPVGTVALWPAAIAAGATIGVLVMEVLKCYKVASLLS